ncbi:TadE family protein [Herpetosiphon geysericola]|uniref:TadE family protein n=1 Tax=Herpetosiphon geysericola TaxID=70996 RepID=UPI0006C8EB39|nr:TadE family protein [Herpetosiphon geysericola]
MHKLKYKRKQAGQALVEFALTVTVLFVFLAGIIDFGLAFFAYQGLKGAAHEAVSYGSLFPLDSAGNFNYQEIRNRLRYESGAPTDVSSGSGAGLRFVDLFDLNNDKNPDGLTMQQTMMPITFVKGSATGESPLDCMTPQTLARQYCDIRVTVRYIYKPLFPFADLITSDGIELKAVQQLTIP